ncbi:hypothetical protein SGPA1_21364 [Streptomyces misionensis JCM 4497]
MRAFGAGFGRAGHPSVLDLIETEQQQAEHGEKQNRDGDHWRYPLLADDTPRVPRRGSTPPGVTVKVV